MIILGLVLAFLAGMVLTLFVLHIHLAWRSSRE